MLPQLGPQHDGSYGFVPPPPPPMSVPPNGMVAPPPLNTSQHTRKRRLSEDSYATSATPLHSVVSAGSNSTYADADSVHSYMAGHIPDHSPLSSSMPPPMSTPMAIGAPLTHSTSAPSPINPPIIKKSRVNTPWTPAEEHRLKLMRDNGDSWAVIAKVCKEDLIWLAAWGQPDGLELL